MLESLVVGGGSSFRFVGGVLTTGANLLTMPRRSSHEIVLDGGERAELERIAGLLKAPFREVQRARIVLYTADGLRDVEIAQRLDCTPKTVAKWRRRFCEQRVAGLCDESRVGRPRRFPPGRDRPGQGDRLRVAAYPRRPAIAVFGG